MIKNSLQFLLVVVLVVVSTSCKQKTSSVKARAEDNRPNILFLFTDDHRRSSLGSSGVENIRTPNLDKLVKNGTSFTNSYILGATTAAVCSPSRAMLMTGRHYFNIEPNVYAQFAFPRDERGKSDKLTFPEHFKANGYQTFATGKQHNGKPWVERGFDNVKSAYLGGMGTHFGIGVKDYTPETGWSDPYNDPQKFSSNVFADAAIGFLQNHKKENPFLMYVAFTSPHDPRTPPKEYLDMYNRDSIAVPLNFLPEHPFPIADDRIRDELLVPFPRTKAVIQEEIAKYYEMIAATDAQIGRILKALKDSGKAENTIIVFAGDNGLALGQHGLLGKQNVYEASVGVPLVFAGPNIPKNKKSYAYAYLHDIFPTLCGLTGLEIPASVETKDLSPVIRGEKETVRNSMMYAYNSWPGDLLNKNNLRHHPGGGERAVRKGDYKLIVSSKKEVFTYLLFDLKKDPWELKNLIAEKEYASVKEDLMIELKKLMKEAGDPADLSKNEFGLFDHPEDYNFKK